MVSQDDDKIRVNDSVINMSELTKKFPGYSQNESVSVPTQPPPLAAPDIVKKAISNAASDENPAKTTTR